MGFLKEFKEFAMKGKVIDLAVGVVIGGAFQAIVTSLVNDVIMPIVAGVTGGVDYNTWTCKIGDVELRTGSLLTAVTNFLIVAFVIFIAIKAINKFNKRLEDAAKLVRGDKDSDKEEDKEPETKMCPYCLTEVKYRAVRCPHCTSELKDEVKA